MCVCMRMCVRACVCVCACVHILMYVHIIILAHSPLALSENIIYYHSQLCYNGVVVPYSRQYGCMGITHCIIFSKIVNTSD